MIDRAMATGRIDDLVRTAEHERLARRVRRIRGPGGRRRLARRVTGVVAATVLWPVRH
jgi:hypothetical protein